MDLSWIKLTKFIIVRIYEQFINCMSSSTIVIHWIYLSDEILSNELKLNTGYFSKENNIRLFCEYKCPKWNYKLFIYAVTLEILLDPSQDINFTCSCISKDESVSVAVLLYSILVKTKRENCKFIQVQMLSFWI